VYPNASLFIGKNQIEICESCKVYLDGRSFIIHQKWSFFLPVSDKFFIYLQMLWFQSLASYSCVCLLSNTMALIGLDSYLHQLLWLGYYALVPLAYTMSSIGTHMFIKPFLHTTCLSSWRRQKKVDGCP